MKKFKLFIGIDISKKWIDVAITLDGDKSSMPHNRFDNDQKGFIAMTNWIKDHSSINSQYWLFCMEHTGVYILKLCNFLEAADYAYVLESPLRIHNSLGIKRGKNDKADSKDIAYYVHLKRNELKVSQLPSVTLMELKALYTQRRQYVKSRTALLNSAREQSDFIAEQYAQSIMQDNEDIAALINIKIKKVERRMKQIIKADQKLYKQYKLIESVKGIGLVNAVLFLIHAKGFTTFSDPKKYASHAGTAPFGQTSGSSIKRAPKVSPLANRHIKAMLTQAANSAVMYDKQIRQYYLRKIEQGKNKFSVLNAVKNKLIHRVFAVVKRGTPYVEMATYT